MVNDRSAGGRRLLPLVLVATTLVLGTPIAAIWFLIADGVISSFWVCVGIAVVVSVAVSRLGDAYWRRRRHPRDVVFSELMLWGWVGSRRVERQLSRATAELGLHPGAGSDRLRETSPDERRRLVAQLAIALDALDPHTKGHSRRVARHAAITARRMGLSGDEIALVRTAGLVHDIGKLRMPVEILTKPGRLTPEEYEITKRHVADGAEMVAVMDYPGLSEIVLHHHERWDGGGYPEGQTGAAIPVGARIIAVADTFDAITSARPYRDAESHQRAFEVIDSESGSQFDPDAVRGFRGYYAGGGLAVVWAMLAVSPARALAILMARAGVPTPSPSGVGVGVTTALAAVAAAAVASVIAVPSAVTLTSHRPLAGQTAAAQQRGTPQTPSPAAGHHHAPGRHTTAATSATAAPTPAATTASTTSASTVTTPANTTTASTTTASTTTTTATTTSASTTTTAPATTPRAATTTALHCVPDTVTAGDRSTCTVTVADADADAGTSAPTGAVTVTAGSPVSVSPGSCTLTASGHTASCTISLTADADADADAAAAAARAAPTAVAAGSVRVSAHYGGDGDHDPSDATTAVTVTVTAAATREATTTVLSCVPADVTVQAATVCTATVSDSSPTATAIPTGTIDFAGGAPGGFAATTCALAAGGRAASCAVEYTPPAGGAVTLSARYAGDAAHAGSTATTSVTVTVPPQSTATAVSCSPGSVVLGASSTCTVTVSDSDSVDGPGTAPTGAVTLSDGAGGTFAPSTCTLSGTASPADCQVDYSPAAVGSGQLDVTAAYAGDQTHSPSTGAATVTVTAPPQATSASLSCSPSTVTVGVPTVCTVMVSDAGAGPGVSPTGTVTFAVPSDGSVSPGSCTLAASGAIGDCQVDYTPSDVGTGQVTLTAAYAGDAGHVASSAGVTVTVSAPAPQSTATALICSPSSVAVGTPTVCTVTVTDTGTGTALDDTPNGAVTFIGGPDGSFAPSACTLTGTGASADCQVGYTPSAVALGIHPLAAHYQGDAGHLASAGRTVVLVTPATEQTATSLDCTPSVIAIGDQTACTVIVSDRRLGATATPGGSVQFTGGPGGRFSPGACVLAGSGNAAGCTVDYTATAVLLGLHPLLAAYPGDGAHDPSQGVAVVTVTFTPPAGPTPPAGGGHTARTVPGEVAGSAP